MNSDLHNAVRQVLREAAQYEHFFDFSDAERLNWMISRAFQIGKEERDVISNHTHAAKGALLGELKQKRSKTAAAVPGTSRGCAFTSWLRADRARKWPSNVLT